MTEHQSSCSSTVSNTDVNTIPFITIQTYISSPKGADCTVSALVDTGCQSNVITPQHVAQLKIQHLVKPSQVSSAIMANATHSAIEGELSLTITTVDPWGTQVPYTGNFLVLEVAQAHLILGLPWFKEVEPYINPTSLMVDQTCVHPGLSKTKRAKQTKRIRPHLIRPVPDEVDIMCPNEEALSPVTAAPSALSTHGTWTVVKGRRSRNNHEKKPSGKQTTKQMKRKQQLFPSTRVQKKLKTVALKDGKRTERTAQWKAVKNSPSAVSASSHDLHKYFADFKKKVQPSVQTKFDAQLRHKDVQQEATSSSTSQRQALSGTSPAPICLCHMTFEKTPTTLCSWKTFAKNLKEETSAFREGSAFMGVLYPQQPETSTTQCNLVGVTGKPQVQLSEDEAIRQRDIQSVLQEYDTLFQEPIGLPPSRHVTHKIQLMPDAKPVRRAPYRLALTEQAELQKQLKDLLDKGFICPSHSSYASPCLFVKKKDGTFRMCCDYRALNTQTVKSQYPLPRIEDILDQLGSAKYFSKLDLAAGYHQIKMEPDSAYLTAIQTKFGLYEWKVMPFGLTNAPSTFQQCMDATLEGLIGSGVAVYLDDIIIYTETWEEHVDKVKQVFNRLLQHHFKVKLKKCEFGQTETTYLGHTLKGGQIAVQNDKVQAVSQLPVPTTIRQLRSFLGACNYYRRFIKDYAKIAKPLTQLLKKDTLYVWTEDRQSAFDFLKEALSTAPILKVPDPNSDFVVWCDASDYALGAVLAQEMGSSGRNGKMLQPVAYISHTFSPAQTRYPIRDKELLAAIIPLNKWRHYLYGKHFFIYTDHKSLTNLYTQKELTGRPARWLDKFQEYDFDVCYKQGAQQFVPDMLSRYPRRIVDGPWQDHSQPAQQAGKVTFCQPLSITTRSVDVPMSREQVERRQAVMNWELQGDPVATESSQPEYLPSGSTGSRTSASQRRASSQPLYQVGSDQPMPLAWSAIADNALCLDLQAANTEDEQVRDLMQMVRHGRMTSPQYAEKEFGVEHQLLYVRKPNSDWKIWVPREDKIKRAILNQLHDAPLAGHPGVKRTVERVAREYYWPGMYNYIQQYVSTCPSCQRHKRDYGKKAGLLQPIPAPTERWQAIAMDFVGPLTMSRRGNNFLLVVTDRFTHRCVLIPTTSVVSAAQTATLLIDNVIKVYGFPQVILSDRDTRFTSQIWTELMSRLGIKLKMTTAYHPQTDGQVERLNQVIATYLRHYVQSNPTGWDDMIAQAEMALNTTVTDSTGYTPFYADTGRHMQRPAQLPMPTTAQARMRPHDLMRKVLSDLHEAHTDMAVTSARAKATMKQQSDKHRKEVTFQVGQKVWLSTVNLQLRKRNRKFAPRWIGPYSITEVKGPVNVRLNLPQEAGINNLVHVDLLKRYHEPEAERVMQYAGPEDLLEESQYEVERIVGERVSQFGREYLVKWANYPDNDRHNSWLTVEELSEAPEVVDEWKKLKALHPTRRHEDVLHSGVGEDVT